MWNRNACIPVWNMRTGGKRNAKKPHTTIDTTTTTTIFRGKTQWTKHQPKKKKSIDFVWLTSACPYSATEPETCMCIWSKCRNWKDKTNVSPLFRYTVSAICFSSALPKSAFQLDRNFKWPEVGVRIRIRKKNCSIDVRRRKKKMQPQIEYYMSSICRCTAPRNQTPIHDYLLNNTISSID